MRFLLISDIHSNVEAFDAVMEAAPSCDRILNLGDLVGYGGSPNEVTDAARNLGAMTIRGNHDRACTGLMTLENFNPIAGMAALWTAKKLTPKNLEWLKVLPPGPAIVPTIPLDDQEQTWSPGEGTAIQIVHGSPLDEDEYIIVTRDATEPLARTRFPLTFFGHTHIQGGFCQNGNKFDTLRPEYSNTDRADKSELPLQQKLRYLINPGSIGQPRDGDVRAAFAVFDSDKYSVTYHRVPYNVKAAQEHIYDAKLPERLATRLAEGR
ncbi:MAG: metallophosphoesterase family protein [Acidobacteria bacterium]|nr:metallophosphoesterase family protein [Acidobacteriota bacterium]